MPLHAGGQCGEARAYDEATTEAPKSRGQHGYAAETENKVGQSSRPYKAWRGLERPTIAAPGQEQHACQDCGHGNVRGRHCDQVEKHTLKYCVVGVPTKTTIIIVSPCGCGARAIFRKIETVSFAVSGQSDTGPKRPADADAPRKLLAALDGLK